MDSAPSPSIVYIVLGSYNGARYIRQQIQSIREQTFQGWTLFIRDDGSSDNTTEIIRDMTSCDRRVMLIEDHLGRQDVVRNFDILLRKAYEAGAEYVFLADQDDVWRNDKIDVQLEAMRRDESTHGSEMPLLVHSDLVVVDGNLNQIRESFMAYQHIRHEEFNSLTTLLVQNFVTGCGTLVNRALLKVALPLPASLLMHDWWLALCAATVGKITYVNEALVLYRQHEKNVVGASGWWLQHLYKASIVGRWRRWTDYFHRSIYQAEQLRLRLQQYDRNPSLTTDRIVKRYCAIFNSDRGRIHRVKSAALLRIHRQRMLDTFALYASIMLWRGRPEPK